MNVLTSSHQIDVQDLLQPIPGVNPAGESLRYQGTYDRIADARREIAEAGAGTQIPQFNRNTKQRPPRV